MTSRFERFSEQARRSLDIAQEEAQQRNHLDITPEHPTWLPTGFSAIFLMRQLCSVGNVFVEALRLCGERDARKAAGLT